MLTKLQSKLKSVYLSICKFFLFLIILFVFILWSLLYPILRKRYKKTQNPKHFPATILLKINVFFVSFFTKFIF